jgi:hypothetical protein
MARNKKARPKTGDFLINVSLMVVEALSQYHPN